MAAAANSLPIRPPLGSAAAAATGMRLSVMVGLFAAALLAVAWISVSVMLQSKRQDALEAETRQNTNLATVLTEQTLRVLATIDQATLRVAQAVSAEPQSRPDLVRFANETGLAPGILVQLSQVDANGRFVGSNLDPDGEKSRHVDLSSREHVRVHLDPAGLPAGSTRPAANGLFIGKPVLGKVSNKWTIQLSRRIADAGGRSLGVVVASLDPSYFESVYRHVALGTAGGVTLLGADLGLRARVIGGVSVGMGSSLPKGSAFESHIGQSQASYLAASSVDGVPRLVALHRVADYPLYVAVSSSLDEALADWRANRDVLLMLAGILSLVVVVASVNFVLGLRRLERSNEALRISEAQAQAASQAKSEFLAAISHELRTPLTSIRGFAELMERRLEQPKFREQAGLIRRGAEHLNNLLTEILDLAKVEAGAMQLRAEPVDLRALVQGTVDFFALSASDKGLALAARIGAEVPATFDGDSLRLKQILNNLLSNALKFTAAGSVTLSAEVVGDELLMHVDDTGPGIAPQMQEAVFEKFRQGDARVSYQHGGTGLGLALSRSLAELMHGRLSLQSTPGQGSRFTLALPLPRR